jgi:hypothetical protein
MPEIRNQAAYDAAVARNAAKKSALKKEITKTLKDVSRSYIPKAKTYAKNYSKSYIKKSPYVKKIHQSLRDNPLVNCIRAHIHPEKIEYGTASGLTIPRPSQKFTARALSTVVLATTEDIMIGISPSIANDLSYPSAVVWKGTNLQFQNATSTFTSSTVGANPAGTTLIPINTNTPYNAATLDDGNSSWRLVSAFIRVRYTGAAQYQNGTCKFFDDLQGQVLEVGETTTLTLAQLTTRLESNHGTIRKNINSSPVCEFVIAGMDHRGMEGSWSTDLNPCVNDWSAVRCGGTTSTLLLGQPASYLYLQNGGGATVSYDIELIEHWECRGTLMEMLHTPSTAHASVCSSVLAIAQAARKSHAQEPSKSFGTIFKAVSSTIHNKAAMHGVEDLMGAAIALI